MTKKEEALVEQYAKSLVEVANEHQVVDQIKQDVLALLETFDVTKLDTILSSLTASQAEKQELIRLLKDPSSVYLNNFLELIILNGREALLHEILKKTITVIAQETKEFDVTITSTVPLSEEQKQKVIAIVESKFGLRTDCLIEKIDESLIGGFILTVNNKVIDTSIRRQLQEFKMNLL
ncbi:F0F1 ATP synthase subunit delta [Streptococcus hongkongensis]|nr:ATP synthase F0F1 subunit delta [Streptococcus uberis]